MEDVGSKWMEEKDGSAAALLGRVLLALLDFLTALLLAVLRSGAVLRGRGIGLIGIHVQTSFPGMRE